VPPHAQIIAAVAGALNTAPAALDATREVIARELDLDTAERYLGREFGD
jgi:hypothetical protein